MQRIVWDCQILLWQIVSRRIISNFLASGLEPTLLQKNGSIMILPMARSILSSRVCEVNFQGQSKTMNYLKEMKLELWRRGASVLIMCDGEGMLGAAIRRAEKKAVENHKNGLRQPNSRISCYCVSEFLYCAYLFHQKDAGQEAINVCSSSPKLCEFAMTSAIDVIIENMVASPAMRKNGSRDDKQTAHKAAGLLNFGEFCHETGRWKGE